ncbi:hypothetical protein DM860_009294 [Cuscuta australis]|uniref:Uncharacterized protein n=1 Tax=Cuscuta australis TaxID=267555 RepID=A0A328DAG0_9ASTE|nr:hypothetical protein DM860_009294 [Cuscuta australis]
MYYFGLNRLVLGLRFRSAVLRCGWNCYCQTNIYSPIRLMGMHTISPVNPEIVITSKPDNWVTRDASGFDLNNKIIDEHHEGEWFSKDHQPSMKWMESLWAQIGHIHWLDKEIDVKSMLDDWVDFKEEASAGYLKRIIRRLRKDGRFSLALKVSSSLFHIQSCCCYIVRWCCGC